MLFARGQRVSARVAALSPPLRSARRSFWGGAFESEFLENRAMARRRRIRGFLGAIELLPEAAHKAPQELARTVFAEHASTGAFHSQAQLRGAVDDVRLRLADMQPAAPFILQLDEATPAADSSSGSDSSGAGADASAGAAIGTASSAPVPDVGAAATPPPLPPSEMPELAPDELTEEQQSSLASMHTSAALDGLPALWAALTQQPERAALPAASPAEAAASAPAAANDDGGAPASSTAAAPAAEGPTLALPVALQAAFALSAPDPWERVRFHVALGRGDVGQLASSGESLVGTASTVEVRAAALATAHAAEPLLSALLEQSELLDEDERKRLGALQAVAPDAPPAAAAGFRARLRSSLRTRRLGVGEVLTEEITRMSRLQRLGRLALGSQWDRQAAAAAAADGAAPLAIVAAADGRHAALYQALKSDATLHLGLTQALFAHHDRLSTRHRRRKNAAIAIATFIGLNLLDFTICNI